MFSLDVTSLFTNVPVDFAVECVSDRWEEIADHTKIDQASFLTAVKLVLESTFFTYHGNFFQQTYGVPMGSPLSPIVANVVMERLEQTCINTLQANHMPMEYYRRYVDDCFCIAKPDQIEEIVKCFNSFHEKLQFTVELENSGQIKFLDINLTKNETKVKTWWKPKQENGRYLDYISETPHQHKRNTAIALIDRAIKLTNAEDRPIALRLAQDMLKRNNYPQWFVRKITAERVHKMYNTLGMNNMHSHDSKYVATSYIPCLSEKLNKILKRHNINLALKPPDKIKNRVFSKLKDPQAPGKQKCVVYSIPCGADDGKVYIGQTGRKLETRIAEHKNDVRKKEAKTGLATHAVQAGHVFAFDKAKILEKLENQGSRMVAEMIHIKLRGEEGTANLQRECGVLDSGYNALLNSLKASSRVTQ